MGNITPAAAAYTHFIEYAIAFFGNDHFQPRVQPRGIDGAKKAGGSAAYNNESLFCLGQIS